MPDHASHAPPHDAESERQVLSSMMLDVKCAYAGAQKLKPEHFYSTAHQLIFDAARAVALKGDSIDHQLVRARLIELGALEEAGGIVYLAELIGGHVTTATFDRHCGIVLSCYRRREAIVVGADLARSGYERGLPVDALIRDAADRLLRITLDETAAPIHVREAVGDLRRRLLAGIHHAGIETGFDPLDSRLQGLRRGEFGIIGGRPGSGKSSLAMAIAEKVAASGRSVQFFTLEMLRDSIASRLVRLYSGVDTVKSLPDGERKTEAILAAGRLAKLPLWIDDVHRDLLDIGAVIRAERIKGNCDVVFIDYIGLIDGARGRTDQERMAYISKSLKALAASVGIPIVAMSQFSRDMVKENRKPNLTDLRGSGALEQDSDWVLLLHRPGLTDKKAEHGRDDGLVEFILAKNRNGELGVDNHYFQFTTGAFLPAYTGGGYEEEGDYRRGPELHEPTEQEEMFGGDEGDTRTAGGENGGSPMHGGVDAGGGDRGGGQRNPGDEGGEGVQHGVAESSQGGGGGC